MSSVSLRPLSALEVECHRLLRLIVRAYYDPLHVMVAESLLYLVRVPSVKLINDAAIAERIGLSVRVVRGAIADLKNDQLIHATYIANERTDAEAEALSERLIRRGVVRRERFDGAYSVDCELVLMTVKYRHSQIHKALTMTHDSTVISYECVTPDCPQRFVARSLLELIAEAAADNNPRSSDFRCRNCQRIDPNGNIDYSPLRLVENPLQTSQNDRERLLQKFNTRKIEIDRQIKAADAIADATRDTESGSAEPTAVAADTIAPAMMADIEVDITDARLPLFTSAAAATASASVGTNRVLHAPTVRADTAKGTVAALPWMTTHSRTPESAAVAPINANAVDAAAAASELERLRAAAAANTATASSAPPSDSGGGYVHFRGAVVAYNDLTDDDVRGMSASELAEYEAVANDMGDAD